MNWTDVALDMKSDAPFSAKGKPVVLMLDGECEIDFFWFESSTPKEN